MTKIIINVFVNRFADDDNESNFLFEFETNIESQFDNRDRINEWKTKKIDFFDSNVKNFNENNDDNFIVNFDRYIFYTNVYVFIDKFKNMILIRDDVTTINYVSSYRNVYAISFFNDISWNFSIWKKICCEKLRFENDTTF